MLNKILSYRIWPGLAALMSGAMLAAAHGFERFMFLYPCPLCLRQREVYWTALAVGVAGLIAVHVLKRDRMGPLFSYAMTLIFLVGFGVASYHAGVEWGLFPSTCAAETFDPSAYRPPTEGLREASGACDEAPFYVLGLSMAGWNALFYLALAGASLIAGRSRKRPFPHVEAEV